MFVLKFNFCPEFEGCLGGEEEVWTRGIRDGELVPAAPLVFQTVEEGSLKPELPAHQIEITTGICRTSRQLANDLTGGRATLVELGRRFGFTYDTSPMPPVNGHGFQPMVYPKPRYLAIAAAIDPAILRNAWIAGLHIHRGCNSLEQAIQLLNGLREFLPLFLAVSAVRNGGRRASERFFCYQRMQRGRTLVPPVIEGPEHFCRIAREQGFEEDPRSCWWGVRINPQGTVEVRVFDMQESANHAGELAALVAVVSRMILRGVLVPRGTHQSAMIGELTLAATDITERAKYRPEIQRAIDYARTDYPEEVEPLELLLARVFN